MRNRIIEFALALLSFSIVLSCRTQHDVVTVEKVHSDTTLIHTNRIDSVYTHDSTYIYMKESGDTVYVYKDFYHDYYHYKVIHDTSRVVRVDSIPVIKTMYIEKNKSFYEKVNSTLGKLFTILLTFLSVGCLIILFLKKMKL